ncbi:MAG: DEAD/DEAH box helicase [Treponema sp.]|jgi:ATP-dependent Lhr-like helicase|nr:DEAD/DEAH box helicase [Treponema sp.]
MSSLFHPLIQAWFDKTYGKPTAVQEQAWPLIAGGEHVLALAPTGSGKTLTSFLVALSRFCSGDYRAEKLSVLYVSPLKALNEDIKRNLLEPLAGIRSCFESAGEVFPHIRVETRSGDTPQADRRRFLNKPPSILAVTPESLAILLHNPRARPLLAGIRLLILDEIHAVLADKRGSFLCCQVDRLSLTAGEFQRIGLSATVRPPEAAAEFLGGLKPAGLSYVKRPVHIVSPPIAKRIEFKVEFPERKADPDTGGLEDMFSPRYDALVEFILERIRLYRNRGTILVFVDSRRRAERLSFLINEKAGVKLAHTHHGSLSLEERRAVEKRLAAGLLPCVTATSSLELGIDIGSVAEVILAGSPQSAAAALQRIGRSGHGVGQVSRGTLIPFHGMDLLLAAALAGAVAERDIEETFPIANPLDVLSQIVLSLCAERERNEDELFNTIRGFYPYRDLNRSSFDQVILMLTGHYGGNGGAGNTGIDTVENTERIRELKPRLYLDRETGILTAGKNVLYLLYGSGGVIPNRGLYSLRLEDGTRIGELDEEFVWERRVGDEFDFGARSWRIQGIGSEAVVVSPLDRPSYYTPFWKGGAVFRSPVLADRILGLLDRFNEEQCGGGYGAGGTGARPENPPPHGEGGGLTLPPTPHTPPSRPVHPLFDGIPGLSETARGELAAFLDGQRRAQGGLPLPGHGAILIETTAPPERGDCAEVILHTFRGSAINYPLSLSLTAELEKSLRLRIEVFSDDNAVLLLIPRFFQGEPQALIGGALERLGLRDADGSELWMIRLRERLLASGLFGAAFREAAERSLLLPKSGFGKRTPLWLTRQRSKRLFDEVSPFPDFPVNAEAWRTCLHDEADLAGTGRLFQCLSDGTLRMIFFTSPTPSPFARGMVHQEISTLMYEDDERKDLRPPLTAPYGQGGRHSAGDGLSLSDRIIEEALNDARRRPRIPAAAAADFCARLRRELPSWAPDDETGLAEWVKERIAIPLDEWETLRSCLSEPLRNSLDADPSLGGRLLFIRRHDSATDSLVHREWADAWRRNPAALALRWLRYEGPVSLPRVAGILGLSLKETEDALFTEGGGIVSGVLLEADTSGACNAAFGPGGDTASGVSGDLVCDRRNFEMLLRLSRKKRRVTIKERPAAVLAPFLAQRQGICFTGNTPAGIPAEQERKPWDKLCGISAPVKLWEAEFFPARTPLYYREMLDRELAEGNLIWYGRGRERAGFCKPEDVELFMRDDEGPDGKTESPFPADFFDSPRNFFAIKEAGRLTPEECINFIWEEAWSGKLSADTWEPVRRGIAAGFRRETARTDAAPPLPSGFPPRRNPARRRVPRALGSRRGNAPLEGNWFSLVPDYEAVLNGALTDGSSAAFPPVYPPDGRPEDALDEEELNLDRIKILIERWGLLCRPLLEREDPCLSWKKLLPQIRRLELAGELIAGRFFDGINSLQFAPPRILRELEAAETAEGIYRMNAADPASLAGLAVAGLDPRLPSRLASNRICLRGTELLAVSVRGGRELNVFIPPDDPCITTALAFVKTPGMGGAKPPRKALIEKVNGVSAAMSGYREALQALGFVSDRGSLVLW